MHWSLKKTKRQASTAYSDVEQQAICASFRNFATVHQNLLKTVIGKHGLLSRTPFTAPIGAILRTLEGAVDTLAFSIVHSVPNCAQDAKQFKSGLDTVFEEAITTYQ
ncbi:hypothetical protein LQW54_013169 [Pestalotiopsis sp. IQ-011]